MKKLGQCACNCHKEPEAQQPAVELVQVAVPVQPETPAAEPECCGGCDNCDCQI